MLNERFLDYEQAQLAIRRIVDGSTGALVSRLGSVEYDALRIWSRRGKFFPGRALPQAVHRLVDRYAWNPKAYDRLETRAGFFPITPEAVEEFCTLYLSAGQEIDLFGSWLPEDDVLAQIGPEALVTALPSLEPFFSTKPWTEALGGRKVLVVSPFESTIRNQFRRREEIFENSKILPEFELLTVRAPQTKQANDRSISFKWSSWFDALSATTDKIGALDFDVAVIGAGAYGLPIGQFIKHMGRVAIHLGGPTQLVFGIRGSRWEKDKRYSALMNGSWVYPSSEETPWFFREQGGYWGPKHD